MFDFSKIVAAAEMLETGVSDIDSRMEEIANRIHMTNRLLACIVLMKCGEELSQEMREIATALSQWKGRG